MTIGTITEMEKTLGEERSEGDRLGSHHAKTTEAHTSAPASVLAGACPAGPARRDRSPPAPAHQRTRGSGRWERCDRPHPQQRGYTDIVVPVRTNDMDWSRAISFANTTGQGTTATGVGFGWGDKGFYLGTPTWGDLMARVAFKAMFGISNSTVHPTFLDRHGLHRCIACPPILKLSTSLRFSSGTHTRRRSGSGRMKGRLSKRTGTWRRQ